MFEGGKVRQLSRHIDKGVGVRVLRGDASGFAYTEELTEESIRRACRTAACIATGEAQVSAQAVQPKAAAQHDRYHAESLLVDRSFKERMELVRRPTRGARRRPAGQTGRGDGRRVGARSASSEPMRARR